MEKKSKEIFFTEDLTIFKKISQNRNTTESHVKKLCEAMSRKNLTIDIPILVTKNYEILDGQHRLEAAIILGIPIYFQFAEKAEIEDVPMINSINKKWTPVEYMNKYIEQGNFNYIKFNEFMQKNNIKSINIAKKLILNRNQFKQKTYFDNNGWVKKEGVCSLNNCFDFNNGNFLYPIDDSFAYKKIQMLKDLSIITISNNCFEGSLIIALDCLLDNEKYDHNYMKEKIKLEKVGGYSNARELVEKFEKCYNYHLKFENHVIFRKP